jgi:hypothetical protein
VNEEPTATSQSSSTVPVPPSANHAIGRANKTTSAATMVTLSEGFRSAWGRLVSAEEQQKSDEVAELLNLLEIACAIRMEGCLSGNSARLLEDYLKSVLRIVTRVNPLDPET